MEIKIPKSTAPRPDIAKIKSSKSGTVTLLEETRLGEKQTKDSLNLIQVQDGVWRTRWGREFYGAEISAETDLDAAFEYVKDRGMSTEERHIVVVGRSGAVYVSVDDANTWTLLPGASMTAAQDYSGLQINNFLYLANGTDPLTRYDGTNLIQYSGIDIPTNLAITRTTLTTGSYNAYYQVTALNEVGETAGSTEASIQINKERDVWTGTEALNLTWDAVADAIRYQIYYADDSGYETLLGSSTTNSWIDDGTNVPNPYIVTPVDDTTIAPRFRHIELSGNRIWGAGDPDNPYRVHFSGVGQFIDFFSSYYGGGWVDLEYGGRESVVGVVNYRSGKGDEVSTVFTKTPEGTGSIWQVALDVATAGELTFTLPVPSKVVDYIGCTSHHAIVKAGDKVFFPNINGLFDLGNKEQIYNILVSAEVSQSIRPDYRDLSESMLGNMTGYYYDAKLFFSAARSDGENDVVFIYDNERQNWNYYWNFGVRQFLEVSDDENSHHFIYVPTSGNRLVEVSDEFTTDFGEAFETLFVSGVLPFDDRLDSFAKVYQAIVEFGDLSGTVTFEVLGLEKWRGFRLLASGTFSSEVSSSDFTGTLFGDYAFGDESPITGVFLDPTLKKRLRINKRLNRIQFKVSSNESGTEYTLLGLQANGRPIAMMPPNQWRI